MPEFGNVAFWGEGKTEYLEKPFEIHVWANSKLNSYTVNSLFRDLYSDLGPVARSMAGVNQRLIPWQCIGFDTA